MEHERPFPAEGWGTILAALVVVTGFQAMRALFVLAYDYQERHGFASVAGVVALIFVAPLAAPLVRIVLRRWALTAVVVGLVAARLAMQPVDDGSLLLPAVATMLSFVAVTLILAGESTHEAGAHRFVIGVVLGLTADTALRLAFGSWDYVWRAGVVTSLLSGVVAAATLVALWRTQEADLTHPAEPDLGRSFAYVLIGPYLFLQILFLQSAGFYASSGEVSLPVAGALVLVGDALAIYLLIRTQQGSVPFATRALAGVATLAFGWAATALTGPAVLAVAVVAQGATTLLFACALTGIPSRRGVWRTAATVTLGTVLLAAMTFMYQTHYEKPLPFSNTWIPIAAAVLLGIAALRRAEVPPLVHPIGSAGPAIAVVLALVVPLVLWASAPQIAPVSSPVSTLRVMSYNVHSGVDVNGIHALDALARVIETYRPDVVAFQELPRGWPIGGMTDVGAWLERRLAMHAAWGGAADRQFGNLLLSRFPIIRSRVLELPKGTGTMNRSAVWATLDLGGGKTLEVIDTHLQHRPQNVGTRMEEIHVILRAWSGRPHTLVVGDMNFDRPWPEVELFDAAGFVSVQDVTGNGHLATAPSRKPVNRSDWMFGTGDLGFGGFALPRTLASDHLPVLVTVSLR